MGRGVGGGVVGWVCVGWGGGGDRGREQQRVTRLRQGQGQRHGRAGGAECARGGREPAGCL